MNFRLMKIWAKFNANNQPHIHMVNEKFDKELCHDLKTWTICCIHAMSCMNLLRPHLPFVCASFNMINNKMHFQSINVEIVFFGIRD